MMTEMVFRTIFIFTVVLVTLGLPAHSRAQVVLSEFMADNDAGLVDDDGEHSDWIEVANTGAGAVSLLDWALTDIPGDRGQWKFPNVSLSPGERLLVFASGKNRRAPASPLHTNFRLNADGEYLALIRPDGTPATEFSPAYPPQLPDVSFGLANRTATTTVVDPATQSRVHVPASGSLGTTWREQSGFPAFPVS
jgi:Lamin Tail Domain